MIMLKQLINVFLNNSFLQKPHKLTMENLTK